MAQARALKNVYIVAAKRTAFGTYGGKLASKTATDLAEIAAKGALSSANIDPKLISSIIIGNVLQSSKDTHFMARHVGIRIGTDIAAPALAVNRLCGSGFQAVVTGAQEIALGDSEIVLTGGADNMSLSPHALRNGRFGIKLGMDPVLEDTLWHGLIDYQIKTPMGVTAENLAQKYEISREECDAFAVRSQQLWKKAQDAGLLKDEIIPISMKTKKGEKIFEVDEHPKTDTTTESLAKLPPVFKKDGVVTAGNASGICDGAGAVILASEDAVKKHNLTPLARLVGYGVSGCDPHIMGIGPVPAIGAMMKKTGLGLHDMDFIEVNEAFAPQALACQKALDIDPAKFNTCGGAIALGHPIGASGARLTGHLVHKLRQTEGKYAIGSACIGGGQGIAVLLEKL